MRIPETVALVILVLVVIYACSREGKPLSSTGNSEWQECVSFTPLSKSLSDTASYKIERWSYRVTNLEKELAINKSLHISWSEVESVKSAILNNEVPSGANFKIVGDTLYYWGEGDLAFDF